MHEDGRTTDVLNDLPQEVRDFNAICKERLYRERASAVREQRHHEIMLREAADWVDYIDSLLLEYERTETGD